MHMVFTLLGLFCTAQSLKEGDLRLVHSHPTLQSCGRVEVFHNGSWGTVCDNSWHKRDADVVCRQLGYSRGSRFRCRAACFGQGEGKIWMDNLSCPRNGDKLMLCDYRGWGEHDCSHAKDAGVCCKGAAVLPLSQTSDTRVRISCPCAADGIPCTNKIRTVPGDCDPKISTAAVEGMVEISFGDKWVPVGEDAWSMTAAHVACGELGYPRALDTSTVLPNDFCTAEEKRVLKTSSGVSRHVVKSVECSGNEPMLANCTLRTGPGSSSFCAAKLRCGFFMHPDCSNSNVVSDTTFWGNNP